jgi:hypothetical protein
MIKWHGLLKPKRKTQLLNSAFPLPVTNPTLCPGVICANLELLLIKTDQEDI